MVAVLGAVGLLTALPSARAEPVSSGGGAREATGRWWGPLQLGGKAPTTAVTRPTSAPAKGIATPLRAAPARPTTGLGGLPAFSPLGGAPAGGPVVAQGPARPRKRAKPAPTVSRVPVGKVCEGHRQCGKWGVCVEDRCQVQTCKSDLTCPAGAICHRKMQVCKVVNRKPINIAYLFYRSPDRRMTSALGLYWHRKGTRGYRVVAPIYWHFWGKKGDTRVIFPLYVGVRNRVKKKQHHFFLMFHYFRREKPRHVAFNIWPLIFASSFGRDGGGFTFVPLFHYRRRGKVWSAASLLPLPWVYYKRPGKVVWTFFPFTGGMRTREKSFVWALPLNFYWRKKTKQQWLFLPLYYGITDRKAQRHRSVLFPLFYYSRHGKHRHRFVSLLATFSRDRKEGWWWFLWTAPPLFFSRDRERAVDLVFPIFLRYRNKLRRSSLFVVPPLVYYRDHRQRNLGIFPLFFYFGDKRTRTYTTLLFPLFYRHKNADGERVTVFGPWYLRQRPSGWASGLFPVAFFGSHRESAYGVVFPLFWHLKNKRKKSTFTLFGNIYVTTGKRAWSFGIVPLLFAGRSRETTHTVLFPLVWWYRNRVKRREWGVVGPAFWWRDKESWGHGLVPLYWFSRRYLPTGHVLSSLTVLPLFYHLNTPRHEAFITPVGGFVKNRVKRTTTHIWGPAFFHRSPTSRSFGVLPFFASHRDRAQKTRTLFVFPLNFYRKTPQSASLVLFPLVWSFSRPGFRSVLVAPVYWYLRQKKGWNADVVFPIFWHLRKGKARTVVAGPVYWNRTASGTRRFGVAPLFHVGWDKKSTYAHFFPLVWHYQNHEKKTGATVAGLYYDARREKRRDSGVLPLVFWGRWGPKKYPKRYGVGFPLVWHFSDAKKQSSTTFVGPFFWHRRGKVRGGGLAPIFWVQHGPRRAQVTLAPLFHYARKAEQYDFWTPLFGFGGDRALNKRYGYAGPVYWESSPKRKAQVVFPLFWRFAYPETRSSKTLFFPFYYGDKYREGRFDVIFPLVWLSRTVTSRTLFILPLFYDRVDKHEARTTAIVPFLFRRRVHHKRETYWLFTPLMYLRTSPRETDAVFFPLVWHFASPGKSSTVGFPLYWDFKRPGKRSTVFFPLFWRFERQSKVKMLILNTWISYDRSDKTYLVHFLPLFEVARKRPGDFRFNFLLGLFGYEREGRNRYLRLFWLYIKLKPLKAKPAGPSGPSGPPRRATFGDTFYPI